MLFEMSNRLNSGYAELTIAQCTATDAEVSNMFSTYHQQQSEATCPQD